MVSLLVAVVTQFDGDSVVLLVTDNGKGPAAQRQALSLLGVKQWNYLPSNVALRFSQKAAMPSFWSAVEKQRPKTSAS